MATLRSGFDFQHGVSYLCSILTIGLKCTALGWGGTDRETDGRTDGRTLLNAPPPVGGSVITRYDCIVDTAATYCISTIVCV